MTALSEPTERASYLALNAYLEKYDAPDATVAELRADFVAAVDGNHAVPSILSSRDLSDVELSKILAPQALIGEHAPPFPLEHVEELAARLIKTGVIDEYDDSVILVAEQYGSSAIVKALVSRGVLPMPLRALYHGAIANSTPLVMWAYEAGADVNDDEQLLIDLVEHGAGEDMLCTLIEVCGCRMYAGDEFADGPIERGYTRVVHAMAASGYSFSADNVATAIRAGNLDMMRTVLGLVVPAARRAECATEVLYTAVYVGDLLAARTLLESYSACALTEHLIVAATDAAMVRLLLLHETRALKTKKAVRLANEGGHTDIVRMLKQHALNQELQKAARRRDRDAVLKLLGKGAELLRPERVVDSTIRALLGLAPRRQSPKRRRRE